MSDKKIEDGFINDMDNEDYHGNRTHLSSSTLKLLLHDSRAFYKKYVLKEEEEQKFNSNFVFGSYVHCALLEPEKLDVEFAVYPGSARRGKAWKEFKEANPGKEILIQTQYDRAQQIVDEAKKNKDVQEMLSEGVAEQSLFTEIDGVKIKVRPDYLFSEAKGGFIVDVKTTINPVTRSGLMATVAQYDYDLSAALYVDAYQEKLGQKYNFYFIFLQKTSNEVAVVKASKQLIENGRRKYKKALEMYRKNIASGVWFKEGIQELYMYKKDLCFFEEGDNE